MRLLLDTHALIWWLTDNSRLTAKARRAIIDPDGNVFVSPISAYEIAQKVRLGRLPQFDSLAADLQTVVATQGFTPLELTLEQAQWAGLYAHAHRDPFDRFLIAQAVLEELTLVSNEELFDAFGVSRLW